MCPKRTETDGSGQRGEASKPDAMAPDVLEFIQAIDDYKRLNSRPFPSWTEILEILKSLGYERSRAD